MKLHLVHRSRHALRPAMRCMFQVTKDHADAPGIRRQPPPRWPRRRPRERAACGAALLAALLPPSAEAADDLGDGDLLVGDGGGLASATSSVCVETSRPAIRRTAERRTRTPAGRRLGRHSRPRPVAASPRAAGLVAPFAQSVGRSAGAEDGRSAAAPQATSASSDHKIQSWSCISAAQSATTEDTSKSLCTAEGMRIGLLAVVHFPHHPFDICTPRRKRGCHTSRRRRRCPRGRRGGAGTSGWACMRPVAGRAA